MGDNEKSIKEMINNSRLRVTATLSKLELDATRDPRFIYEREAQNMKEKMVDELAKMGKLQMTEREGYFDDTTIYEVDVYVFSRKDLEALLDKVRSE